MAPKRRSLLEASFDAEEGAKKVPKRPTKPPSLVSMVSKAISDNCKGMSAQEIDSVLVNGCTLRQQVYKDKAKNLESPGIVTMGRRYYSSLREAYATAENPRTRLQVTDPNETISDTVFQAMLSTKKNPVNRGPMMNLLQIGEKPNQAELIGILRWCMDLQPSVSGEQARGVLETMRFIKRLELTKHYPNEIALMTDKFNQGLLQAVRSNRMVMGLRCGLLLGLFLFVSLGLRLPGMH